MMFVSFTILYRRLQSRIVSLACTTAKSRLRSLESDDESRHHEFTTTTMNKWGLDAIFCEAAVAVFLPRKRERGPGRARVSICPLPLMALQ